MDRTSEQRREFIICLVAMIFFALGAGAFLLLIVGYQEKRGVAVTEIGSVMSLLSIVEGIVCLLVGHFYRGKYTRNILIVGIALNAAGSLILSFKPLGIMVWAGAAVAGAGFGIVTVIMYVAALQRRPSSLNLGLAVGLYTACIAGGNGLGALVSGWATDQFGFTVSFTISLVCYLVGIAAVLTLSRREFIQPELEKAPLTAGGEKPRMSNSIWILALVTAFTLSSINMVFDILFPVYTLRAGMTFTLVGSLSGIKMVMAALVRPFSGALMARLKPLTLNNWSLAGLGIGTALIPVVGFGFGLTAVIALMGVTFGSCRTTSATLVVKDQGDPHVVSRRISYYNTSLTLGQTIAPWFTGFLADRVDVRTTLIVLPVCWLVLYGISSLALPRLISHWQDSAETRMCSL
jgi:MFS family permease